MRPKEPAAGAVRTSIVSWLRRPLRWTGTEVYRPFVFLSLTTIGAILLVKVALDSPIRLQVYVVEVGVMFGLAFVFLEGERARSLRSHADRADAGVVAVLGAALVGWNAGFISHGGVGGSPEPGFADAILLVVGYFVVLYGRRNARALAAPLSLLVLLAGITVFVSNEDPTFYAVVGRHFVSLTVWMSASLLALLGYALTSGPDAFTILGPPSLRVEVGIRCGGLDIATIYSLLIGYFAWKTNLRDMRRIIIVVGAVVGIFVLNGLRVVFLTVLFLSYPPDLVEAVHTNVGDFIFLAYALPFVVVLHRYRAPPPGELGPVDPRDPPPDSVLLE